jgi:hypothetical protein
LGTGNYSLLIYMGVALLCVLTFVVAVLGLYLVWRDGYGRGWRAAKPTSPRCPGCGYDMSGLTRCRCPECGGEFSIEEILGYVPDPLGTALNRIGRGR